MTKQKEIKLDMEQDEENIVIYLNDATLIIDKKAYAKNKVSSEG